MSKKKQNSQKSQPVPTVENIVPKAQHNIWRWLAGILLITLIAYAPVLSDLKEFTNWDDDGYITDQPLIKSLDGESVGKMFETSSVVMLNYHPLTMLSLAIDYQRAYDDSDNTLSVAPFAATNIILHLLNTALVFILLYRLSKKRIWAAALPALLFGIHPMHVESVAWLSERKDVLYCFFFLLSCIAYLRYLDKQKYSMLALSFLLFIAACLSKAMATPLPIVLLLIDYLEKRKFTAKVWLEKLPYFAVAIWVGYLTLGIQDKAIADAEYFNFAQRVMFASYGLFMYWVKLVAPLSLSAIYPYPAAGNGLPFIFYIAPFVAIALIVLPIYLARGNKERQRETIFGIGFYLAMILLVLQFLSVGQAIMADRYSYVAYIGPLFILGLYVHDWIQTPRYKNIALGIAGAFSLVCVLLTYQRIAVWNDSKTLWADVIDKYPYEIKQEGNNTTVVKRGVKTAYKNMGDYYASRQQFDSAYVYYNVLINAGTKDAEVWSNVGNIYAIKNNLQGAIEAYTKAIVLDASNFENYLKRGLMNLRLNNCAAVIPDMDKVIQLNPSFKDAQAIKQKCQELLSKQ